MNGNLRRHMSGSKEGRKEGKIYVWGRKNYDTISSCGEEEEEEGIPFFSFPFGTRGAWNAPDREEEIEMGYRTRLQ